MGVELALIFAKYEVHTAYRILKYGKCVCKARPLRKLKELRYTCLKKWISKFLIWCTTPTLLYIAIIV